MSAFFPMSSGYHAVPELRIKNLFANHSQPTSLHNRENAIDENVFAHFRRQAQDKKYQCFAPAHICACPYLRPPSWQWPHLQLALSNRWFRRLPPIGPGIPMAAKAQDTKSASQQLSPRTVPAWPRLTIPSVGNRATIFATSTPFAISSGATAVNHKTSPVRSPGPTGNKRGRHPLFA